jgi:hypothetical protein
MTTVEEYNNRNFIHQHPQQPPEEGQIIQYKKKDNLPILDHSSYVSEDSDDGIIEVYSAPSPTRSNRTISFAEDKTDELNMTKDAAESLELNEEAGPKPSILKNFIALKNVSAVLRTVNSLSSKCSGSSVGESRDVSIIPASQSADSRERSNDDSTSDLRHLNTYDGLNMMKDDLESAEPSEVLVEPNIMSASREAMPKPSAIMNNLSAMKAISSPCENQSYIFEDSGDGRIEIGVQNLESLQKEKRDSNSFNGELA